MFSDQAHSSSGLSNQAAIQFRRTLDMYKKAILRTLNAVYREIYKDVNEVLNIPGAPLCGLDEITAAYELGVFAPKTMARYVARSLDASENDIDEKRVERYAEHFEKMKKAEIDQAETNVKGTLLTKQATNMSEAQSKGPLAKRLKLNNNSAFSKQD